jgi:hypothetical protein
MAGSVCHSEAIYRDGHPESAAADEGPPGMSKTELLLNGISANTVGVEFQEENTHKVSRERALLAAFKSDAPREVLRQKKPQNDSLIKDLPLWSFRSKTTNP